MDHQYQTHSEHCSHSRTALYNLSFLHGRSHPSVRVRGLKEHPSQHMRSSKTSFNILYSRLLGLCDSHDLPVQHANSRGLQSGQRVEHGASSHSCVSRPCLFKVWRHSYDGRVSLSWPCASYHFTSEDRNTTEKVSPNVTSVEVLGCSVPLLAE